MSVQINKKSLWALILVLVPISTLLNNTLSLSDKFSGKFQTAFSWFVNLGTYPLPSYWVFLIGAATVFLAINFISKNKHLTSEELIDKFDVDVRSHAEQIHFYVAENSEMRIWLCATNFSPWEVVIDKVVWELFLGNTIKKDGKIIHYKISPTSKNGDILIDSKLTDYEANQIRQTAAKEPEKKGVLSLTVSFKINKKQLEKKFSIAEIGYTISGSLVLGEDRLSDKEKFILMSLAKTDGKKMQIPGVKHLLEGKFNLDTMEFNVLVSGLTQKKLIYKYIDRKPYSAANAWSGQEYKPTEYLVINDNGLNKLKEEKFAGQR